MQKKITVVAIVVAFCKIDALRKCITSIQQQSVPVDDIFIIDNTPGEHITTYCGKAFPQCQYIHYHENIGSEGGFSEGIRLTYENYDALWLFDDDCVAEPDALEKLLAISDQEAAPPVGALRCARPWDKSSGENTRSILDLFAWKGTLIFADTVKAIGLPWKELFLYGGDAEYGWRMKKHGYAIYLVYASHINSVEYTDKLDISIGPLNKKIYKSQFRVYYSFRNELAINIVYRNIPRTLRLLAFGAISYIFCLFHGYQSHAQAIYCGLFDGICNNLGKSQRFLP